MQDLNQDAGNEVERSPHPPINLSPGHRRAARILLPRLPGTSSSRGSRTTSPFSATSSFKRWTMLNEADIDCGVPMKVPPLSDETDEFVPSLKSDSDESKCPRMWTSDDSYLVLASPTNDNARPRPSSLNLADVKSRAVENPQHQNKRSSRIKRHISLPSSLSMSLKWVQKTEIYNVASAQIRCMLQPPATSLDLKSVPESAFAGPLLEIFPDSVFPRPSRVNPAEWAEVMGVGKWRYPAEDSGASALPASCRVNIICQLVHDVAIGVQTETI